jgi:hypothetical protein
MTDPDFGPREGETAIALPASFDAGVYFIGRIRTPLDDPRRVPEERRRGGGGLHDRA